jgi:glycerol-3-phosphate dehydrogenase
MKMWDKNWRDDLWSKIDQPWDIVIIGGGITGAGILKEARKLGLKVLLVEQRDFSWGTSSRSSKLVHGGLRYLKDGNIKLTWESVRERKRLLAEGPGLIEPLGFLIANYKGDRPGRLIYRAGLVIYDLLATQWSHKAYNATEFQMLAPHIRQEGLEGGLCFGDAQTNDARLVLRVIREAVADGACAINYVRAETLIRSNQKNDGRGSSVSGVRLHDTYRNRHADIQARVIINATGAWADELRGQVGAKPRMRLLRGSHLVVPAWRLPVAQSVSFLHPLDRRPVFIFPWEGITLIGTTDMDHSRSLSDEPSISPAEVAYLMAAANAQFPSINLTLSDIISTFSGIRPVIGTGKADPSQEARDHAVWEEEGLLTVTGGKLTTFRMIALDVLKAVRHRLPQMPEPDKSMTVLNQMEVDIHNTENGKLTEAMRRRLAGCYGSDFRALIDAAQPEELKEISTTCTLWAELRWAARDEGIVHLEDLMLRRTRLGLTFPEGGKALLPVIRSICQAELGWDNVRWQEEEQSYLSLWQKCYNLPEETIPDWRGMLKK